MYINNIKNQFNEKIWVVCYRVNFNIYRGLKYDWKIKVVWQQRIFIIWIIFAGCLIGHNKILLKRFISRGWSKVLLSFQSSNMALRISYNSVRKGRNITKNRNKNLIFLWFIHSSTTITDHLPVFTCVTVI